MLSRIKAAGAGREGRGLPAQPVPQRQPALSRQYRITLRGAVVGEASFPDVAAINPAARRCTAGARVTIRRSAAAVGIVRAASKTKWRIYGRCCATVVETNISNVMQVLQPLLAAAKPIARRTRPKSRQADEDGCQDGGHCHVQKCCKLLIEEGVHSEKRSITECLANTPTVTDPGGWAVHRVHLAPAIVHRSTPLARARSTHGTRPRASVSSADSPHGVALTGVAKAVARGRHRAKYPEDMGTGGCWGPTDRRAMARWINVSADGGLTTEIHEPTPSARGGHGDTTGP